MNYVPDWEFRDRLKDMADIIDELIQINKQMNDRIGALETAAKAQLKIIEVLIGVRQIPFMHTCNDINPTSTDICSACLMERKDHADQL